MEESKALSKLNEAVDLLVLLEDVLSPSSIERLSSSSWSGLRLTLKNARTILQESQVVLSKDFIARAKGISGGNPAVNNQEVRLTNMPGNVAENSTQNGSTYDTSKVQITRRDLKASLEKFIENR